MKQHTPPWRLINTEELSSLENRIDEFRACIQRYVNQTIDVSLSVADKSSLTNTDVVAINHNNESVACIATHSLQNFKHDLLLAPIDHPVINDVCETILCQAASQFFKLEQLTLASEPHNNNQWCYPGSPLLILTINVASNKPAIDIYLSPQWVHHCAFPMKSKQTPLCAIEDCLEQELITLDLTLSPAQLNLSQLADLMCGDVIELDHATDKPLNFCHNGNKLCQVSLGLQQQHLAVTLGVEHD